MLGGITDVLIGTRDLTAWRSLLVDAWGWDEVASGRDLGPSGAGSLRAAVFAFPGVDAGRVRVIEYGRPVDRGRPTMRDSGPFDFDVYARDITTAHADLVAKGYSFSTEPRAWELDILPVPLYQTILLAPDGVNIAIMGSSQPRHVAAFDRGDDGAISEVTSAIAIVRDVDQSKAFWRDTLGMKMTMDLDLDDRSFELILGEPDPFRLTIFAASEPARSEVITFPDGVVRDRPIAVGTLGQIGWAYRVADIDQTLATITAAGAQLLTYPNQIDDAIHGSCRVALLRSPDGILIEVWQPLP